MKPYSNPHDQKYVESIRRFEGLRRVLAILFVGFGILCLCLGVRISGHLSQRAHLFVQTAAQTAELPRNENTSQGLYLYNLGLKIGTVSSGFIFAATGLIVLGAGFGLGGRRERILMDAFDRIEQAGSSTGPALAQPLEP